MDTSQNINTVEWFFGYGGNHLGLRRAIPNMRLLAACEIEAYATANMVSKMEQGLLDSAPIWSDCKTFPTEPFRNRVGLFIASYPCQGFSVAGERLGSADPRYLWPHVRNFVRRVRPRYCFFENVAGHISLGLSTVLSDLEEDGYTTASGIFSAEEIGASHQRKRVFVLAKLDDAEYLRRSKHESFIAPLADSYKSEDGLFGPASRSLARQLGQKLADAGGFCRRTSGPGYRAGSGPTIIPAAASEHVADTRREGCEGREQSATLPGNGGGPKAHGSTSQLCGPRAGIETLADSDDRLAQLDARQWSVSPHPNGSGPYYQFAGSSSGLPLYPPGPANLDAWRRVLAIAPALEPAVCGVADGNTNRVDRLRLCGNGVVPDCAEKAFRTLYAELTQHENQNETKIPV